MPKHAAICEKQLCADYENRAFLAKLQNQFSTSELVKFFTVSDYLDDGIAVTKCMPAAFPLATKSTSKIMSLFEGQFVSSSQYGGISDFVCEFVEGENGICYFLKIKEFELEPRQEHQKEWMTTKEFKKSSPMRWELTSDYGYDGGCKAGFVCKAEEKFKTGFVSAC